MKEAGHLFEEESARVPAGTTRVQVRCTPSSPGELSEAQGKYEYDGEKGEWLGMSVILISF